MQASSSVRSCDEEHCLGDGGCEGAADTVTKKFQTSLKSNLASANNPWTLVLRSKNFFGAFHFALHDSGSNFSHASIACTQFKRLS